MLERESILAPAKIFRRIYERAIGSEQENRARCVFTLPGFGASNYNVRDDDYLRLADSFDATLLHIHITNNDLTWWTLPPGSSPLGMTVDNLGNLWYADKGTKMLARLDPATGQLTGYLLPEGDNPQMMAFQSGFIWYSEGSLPGIGRLDPELASLETAKLDSKNQLLTPSCGKILLSESGAISISKGQLDLRSITFKPVLSEGGWQIYKLPGGSDPWGIVVTDAGFLVDTGRRLFINFEVPLE